jgi:anti-sigma B factor antagonist
MSFFYSERVKLSRQKNKIVFKLQKRVNIMMNLNYKKSENSIVVYIDSPLDLWNSPGIQKNLDSIIDQFSQYNFVFNMVNMEYMNSAGLGMLIIFSKKLESNHRSLKVSNLNKEVKKVIHILGADDIIDIYDTEEEALKTC